MLNPTATKILKGIHLIFASLLSGGFFSILVLLLLKKTFPAGENTFLMDLSIFKLFSGVIVYGIWGIVVTALIYGLFTNWDFFKHWWVIFKWVLLAILFILVLVKLAPEINGLVAISDASLDKTSLSPEYTNLSKDAFLYTLIGFIAIILIFFISTIKPWGICRARSKISRKVVLSIVLPVILIGFGFMLLTIITLDKYRRLPIADTDLANINDGNYYGEVKMGGYTYRVAVAVSNHSIAEIKAIASPKSPYV